MKEIKTAGEPTQIKMVADRKEINANGSYVKNEENLELKIASENDFVLINDELFALNGVNS